MTKKLDVCLSPELLHLYEIKGKVVVVVDILRATSSMVTALAHHVSSIVPVATLEECEKLMSEGYVGAAEREGKKAGDCFKLGNSPFSYMDEALKGKNIAMTTTNGTLAITRSREAHEIIIGSFLNISSVANYLKDQPHSVVILCSGWKGRVNLEDTLFAGALIEKLEGHFQLECDAPLAAKALFAQAKTDMLAFLANSSHVKRLHNLNITKDIEFCLTPDVYNIIPALKDGALVKMKKAEINGHKSSVLS